MGKYTSRMDGMGKGISPNATPPKKKSGLDKTLLGDDMDDGGSDHPLIRPYFLDGNGPHFGVGALRFP